LLYGNGIISQPKKSDRNTDNNDHLGQRKMIKTCVFFRDFRLFSEFLFIYLFIPMLLPNINPILKNFTTQESTCSINNISKRMKLII
jgi:hypothetical protein